MPRIEAPRIDPRTYSDLVIEVERLIEQYTGWRPDPDQPEAGRALVRIFGRMAELVVTRLNRLPERNYLAFLDLLGTRLNPPQPARVPLTFLLAAGSPVDALVSAGTQAVATELEGEAEPPVFTTERDLVATRSQLVAVGTRERDLWADHTATATGLLAGAFEPFQGDRPIDHRLYVDHPLLGLPEAKTVDLPIDPEEEPWPSVDWSFWDGSTWRPLVIDKSAATLRFVKVPEVVAGEVDGREGHWLRGELRAAGDDWRQPSLTALTVQVLVEGQATVPPRSFANQTPLDLSRDVLPFGDRPKIGDTFYLAGDEALSKPNAEVELRIQLTNPADPSATPQPADSTDVMLAWEAWDGREWLRLGNSGPGARPADQEENSKHRFSDTTNGFLSEGSVRFTVPAKPELSPGDVNREVRHWLRVRIARGNYGVEARYTQVKRDPNGPPSYELVPATFRPPSLHSVRLGYRYESKSLPPRRLLTENGFTFAEVTKLPFTPFEPADDEPTLYLGFERPGDTIGFANRSTALFFQVSAALYDPANEPRPVAEEAVVVWEYWNGKSWQQLGTSDETRGLTRSGLLTFIGPPDFKSSAELGRTAFWLRGRWHQGEYAAEPQLDRVLTNTMWATHAETVLDEVLGSSRAERGQAFRTLLAPVLEGQVLEVIEPEVPSSSDLAALEAEEGEDAVTVVRDSSDQILQIRVRWHEVPDFHGSGPRSRHYVFDPLTGEARFGDGRRGLVPPPGRNNVRMARYRAGGGLAGNRPAGNVARLRSAVPYVAGVVQTLPAEGGAAEESLEAVRAHGPKALRHRDRATAAADFEDLAFRASPLVARARALPARQGSEAGAVGLIIVPASEAARPVPGLELLRRVRAYLEARLSPVVELSVTGPDWLRMDVRAEVVPRRLDAATDVQNAVLARLRAFLHPLSGGPLGDGWDLGRKPHRSDLYALIEETPGVDHVRRLEVTETPEGTVRPGRFQIVSGNHEITIRGSVDNVAAASGSLA